jgi:adenylylsulfate kinase
LSYLTYHNQSISLKQREMRNGHTACVLWFTGLSGSGKSTLAMALQKQLFEIGCQVVVLDGDNVRHGLNADLGFEDRGRVENLRRIAEVSKLFAENGNIVITSFISPFQKERDKSRQLIKPIHFFEIHIDVNLETAESRDPKGLYKKARAGEIENFTGIDSVFETPANPDLKLSTDSQTIENCLDSLLAF